MDENTLKNLLEVTAAETRRHFDVALERVEKRIDRLAEVVALQDESRIAEPTPLGEKIDRGFADTQAMVNFSHSELDRRVRALEED